METMNLLSLITSGASRCSSTIIVASTWDATTLETQNCLKVSQLSIQILKFFLSLPKLTNFKRQLMKNHGASCFFTAKSAFMQLLPFAKVFKFQCYN